MKIIRYQSIAAPDAPTSDAGVSSGWHELPTVKHRRQTVLFRTGPSAAAGAGLPPSTAAPGWEEYTRLRTRRQTVLFRAGPSAAAGAGTSPGAAFAPGWEECERPLPKRRRLWVLFRSGPSAAVGTGTLTPAPAAPGWEEYERPPVQKPKVRKATISRGLQAGGNLPWPFGWEAERSAVKRAAFWQPKPVELLFPVAASAETATVGWLAEGSSVVQRRALRSVQPVELLVPVTETGAGKPWFMYYGQTMAGRG